MSSVDQDPYARRAPERRSPDGPIPQPQTTPGWRPPPLPSPAGDWASPGASPEHAQSWPTAQPAGSPYGVGPSGPGPQGPAAWGQAQQGQPSWGQPPQGPAPWGQAPSGQAPAGQAQWGQPPYGQAQWGQPSYGQPPWGQPAAPTDMGPRNAMHWIVPVGRSWQSILAGYLGIVSPVIWVVAPFAIGVGVWALVAARSGGHGRGRAWTGIVGGLLGVVIGVAVLASGAV